MQFKIIYFFRTVEFKIRFKNAINKAIKSVEPNPSITKLSPIIRFVNKSISALITNKKKPSVRMVAGNVKIIRIGRTKTLTIAKTKLAKIAAPIFST